MLIASSSEILIFEFKTNISKSFDVVDLEKAEHLLGMIVDYDCKCNVMTNTQKEFIFKTALVFDLTDANAIRTSMENYFHLTPCNEPNVNLLYAELLGSLLYISV